MAKKKAKLLLGQWQLDMLSSGWCTRPETTIKTKARVYVVNSLYLALCCETWPLRVEDIKKPYAFDHSYSKYILRVHRADKIAHNRIDSRSYTTCINSTIIDRRLRWLGHILCCPTQELTHILPNPVMAGVKSEKEQSEPGLIQWGKILNV